MDHDTNVPIAFINVMRLFQSDNVKKIPDFAYNKHVQKYRFISEMVQKWAVTNSMSESTLSYMFSDSHRLKDFGI